MQPHLGNRSQWPQPCALPPYHVPHHHNKTLHRLLPLNRNLFQSLFAKLSLPHLLDCSLRITSTDASLRWTLVISIAFATSLCSMQLTFVTCPMAATPADVIFHMCLPCFLICHQGLTQGQAHSSSCSINIQWMINSLKGPKKKLFLLEQLFATLSVPVF